MTKKIKELALIEYLPMDFSRIYFNYLDFTKELKKITIPKNENIIISSHGNTIRESVFDEIRLANYTPNQNEDSYRLDLDEGGFVVISKEGEKLILEHLFFNYNDFVKALSYRPKN